MLFTVIIPVIERNIFLLKCLEGLNKQTYKEFEVILISERKIILKKTKYDFPLRILHKSIVSPGQKRNYASKLAKGKYLSFIDDDAYPDLNWLLLASKKIKKIKNDKFILGGPGILPPESGLLSKIIDFSFRTRFFGIARMRYEKVFKKITDKDLDDWPSVNMFIKKSIFFNLKGFDKSFWPGEDSKLCNSLLKKSGKIYYDPNIFVFHYRRANIRSHIRQIFRYSFARGKFYLHGDLNSRKIIYLIPTFFLFFIVIILFLNVKIFLFILIIFFIILLGEQFRNLEKNSFLSVFLSPIFILLNIFIYGIGFFLSLVIKNYRTKLSR
jgi:GT2 family glycosyltransferase